MYVHACPFVCVVCFMFVFSFISNAKHITTYVLLLFVYHLTF